MDDKMIIRLKGHLLGYVDADPSSLGTESRMANNKNGTSDRVHTTGKAEFVIHPILKV